MSQISQHNNLINGEWVAGSSYTPNINPSNLSDVVGEYAQADMAQLEAAVGAAKAAGAYLVLNHLLRNWDSWA